MDPISIVEAMIEWQKDQANFAFSTEQLYSHFLWVLKEYPNFDSWFATELQKLANTPQGRRMLRDLRKLDQVWGYPLACRGVHISDIMRQGEVDT